MQLALFPQRQLERIEREGNNRLWKTLVEVRLENVTLHLSLKTLHMLRRITIQRPPVPGETPEM